MTMLLGYAFVLIMYVLIAAAVLWFLRTLNNIGVGLREISARLLSIEDAIRHAAPRSTI